MLKFHAPLFASLLLLSGAAIAQSPIVMKIATVAPEKTPWDRLLREYKKNVETKTGGRISVKVYTGGTKGDENDTVLKTRRGELQAVGASTGAIGSIVTELNVIELPYLFKSFREADAVLDNVVSSRLDPILRGYGFVLGFWSENGFRHFGTRDGFVKAPSNLKGKKMRSQESKVHLETWKAFSASPTPVPTTETLTALENKTVDGFDQALLFMIAASWHTTVKYVTLSSHIYQPALIVFNKAWFDGLPADLQKILMDEGRALQPKGRTAVRALNKKLVELLTSPEVGVQVHQLTADERTTFETAARGVRATLRADPKMPKAGLELLDAIEAYLKTFK